MPLIDLGAGASTSNTTRTIAATNSPDAVTLGSTTDADATGNMSSASVIALLKATWLETKVAFDEMTARLDTIIELLANQR